MLAFLNSKFRKEESEKLSDENEVPEGVPQLTKYEFNDVPIPTNFLTEDLPFDAQPITIAPIDWAESVLPEYEGLYAVVLDNVLSPSECSELLRLAQASVPKANRGASGLRFWSPALVNMGGGYEVRDSKYRHSDRIIWDQQEVVDRLWNRCLNAPGLREQLTVIEDDENVLGTVCGDIDGEKVGERWEFRQVNRRMRFLKYTKGQFFRPHCDAAYHDPGDKIAMTLFTVHLYLNDSVAEAGEEAELIGGATSFLSRDEKRKIDVNPKAGRVLIFQHRRLYHSGDEVLAGTKYTMRTDIMYELVTGQENDM